MLDWCWIGMARPCISSSNWVGHGFWHGGDGERRIKGETGSRLCATYLISRHSFQQGVSIPYNSNPWSSQESLLRDFGEFTSLLKSKHHLGKTGFFAPPYPTPASLTWMSFYHWDNTVKCLKTKHQLSKDDRKDVLLEALWLSIYSKGGRTANLGIFSPEQADPQFPPTIYDCNGTIKHSFIILHRIIVNIWWSKTVLILKLLTIW